MQSDVLGGIEFRYSLQYLVDLAMYMASFACACCPAVPLIAFCQAQANSIHPPIVVYTETTQSRVPRYSHLTRNTLYIKRRSKIQNNA